MGRSASWSYVTWYNEDVSSGDWATWEPGSPVSLGDVGKFNRRRCFRKWKNLSDLGIGFDASEEIPRGARFYVRAKDFKAGSSTTAKTPIAGAGITVVARRKHACVLQIRRATDAHILDVYELFEGIKSYILAGPRGPDSWPLDSVVVTERTLAKGGFAAISQAAGHGLELRAAGSENFVGLAPVNANLQITASSATAGFLLFEFKSVETPRFGAPIRVKHDLLDRLLPWRSDGPYIVDPLDRRYLIGQLPATFPRLKPEDACYDPARSAMSPDELASLRVEDLFEPVTSLRPGVQQAAGAELDWSAEIKEVIKQPRRKRAVLVAPEETAKKTSHQLPAH